MGLIAELTHRCPLQCAYCSNPLSLDPPPDELTTDEWRRVLDEAAEIGVLQLHLTGGEPMARRDLVELVSHATNIGLYTNLITSGVLLDDDAMERLLAAGIEHIQLSFQDAVPESADRFGGYRGGHAKKLEAARRIHDAGMPLTANFVIHRQNIERLEDMLTLGEQLRADRIEIAHTQYYGWALLNRTALLPTAEQLEFANQIVTDARDRLLGRITIDYVVPDYYAARPKACMGGWGNRFINISPSGKALPCHAAETIPDLTFPSVREHSLSSIWTGSPAFARFRGTDWMPDPCHSCERREIDWGGCRCQALALTGDATATDPACAKAPSHFVMAAAIRQTADAGLDFVPRRLKGA
ncbi:pyrroloquinoline quinone biosynthesis protein PqqE [Aquisediminimonas sediminicola]|uniref:pyrroloquinoline quinone biosynthesis protein PqqE n=1 Tax=Alteraquisediminimonas sediminicola TaxID=2676787 RepID=UPI001C8EEB03|nr:pyrroloquinoline quinone biosynthesis protein PqqE [Aquisediminimonas sediminicola]